MIFPTMHEFKIIEHFFAKQADRSDVQRGIGDDAALVYPPADHQLAITTDTLIAGVHFPLKTAAEDIGYKSMAVNLSDLAAMGAEPAWVTLALTLPEAKQDWLEQFCTGFFDIANTYNVQLIGGDLTRGPLAITIQAVGFIPKGKGLNRNTAQVGDLIYVTGDLGDAGLALELLQTNVSVPLTVDETAKILKRLNRPEPRIALGQSLRGIANAAIDISDGLGADLGHILDQSNVGAKVFVDKLPLSPELAKQGLAFAINLALNAGDDYELCFTVPKTRHSVLANIRGLTCIGEIVAEKGLSLVYEDGNSYEGKLLGYEHF